MGETDHSPAFPGSGAEAWVNGRRQRTCIIKRVLLFLFFFAHLR